MQTVVIVVHLLIVLTMIGLVLVQKSEGGGLGMGGGGGFMSTRGTANLLSRSTAYLAGAFFVTSLLLSWMAGHNRAPTSIINTGAPAGPTRARPRIAHRSARLGLRRRAGSAAAARSARATRGTAGPAIAVTPQTRAGKPALRICRGSYPKPEGIVPSSNRVRVSKG